MSNVVNRKITGAESAPGCSIDGKKTESVENYEKPLQQVMNIIEHVVVWRDPYTASHQRRTTNLAYAIARQMNIDHNVAAGIRAACAVHDIGKIRVPSEILAKPGNLSRSEQLLIMEHPVKGYEILQTIEFPWPVAAIVLQHHERIDGTGYPYRLKGPDICLEAKVIAVADIVEAMASHRPYRPALGFSAACQQIIRNKGVLYDQQVVDACINLFAKREVEDVLGGIS